MPQRLLLLVGLLTLVGCQNNHEGAVKLTVSYSGFRPGCIRVSVKDEGGKGEERTTELAGKGEVTGGQVTVAAFREAGWSANLLLTAQAFEVACTDKPVSTATRSVKVDKAAVATLELALSGTDSDQDGYVSRATGGSDCDDSRNEARPGATERCNGQDDNCDDKSDEGFEVGVLCDTTEGCKGAWTCDQGARACVSRPEQWRRDSDGDGQGDPNTPGISDCKQPTGYVPNALDCDDGNPRRYKDAPELCNSVDDDCDTLADDGLNVGSACMGAGGCGGSFVCNAADAGVRCDSPTPVVLYPDTDNDTRGKADAGVSSCQPTLPGHVSNANDCDDTQATVYVDAPELCDTQDNDCDGTPDDGLNVGASCNPPGQGCSGKRACAADGGVQCDYDSPPNNYYPDEDLDQHGKADAGMLMCTPGTGYITQAGDCNDGNPFTHADRTELCDQEDNNCNGTTDEGNVCPTGGPTWTDQTSSSSDQWRSVSLWGNGGMWVTGPGNRLRYRAPGATSFENFDGQCAGDWYSVWADPQNGTAFLGGLNQLHLTHSATTTTCSPGLTITNTDVLGVVGVPRTGGGTELHFVGYSRSNASYGRASWWDGTTLSTISSTAVGPLRDVHGLSRDVLFAVGGYQPFWEEPGSPRIYRFKPGQPDTWQTEAVQEIPGVVPDELRGIWVVNPKLAYAVGRGNSVLRWNGTKWELHSGPNAGDLFSVVAFGTSSVYVSTANGRVYRYDGTTWSAMPGVNTGAALYDIAGTSPADLWVVGENGKRLHWPR